MGRYCEARAATIFTLFLLVLAARAFTPKAPPAAADHPPSDGAFVGVTRERIVGILGKPAAQWTGPYGMVSLAWANDHKKCESLTFYCHNGTLYICVEPDKAEQWVCIESNWLPRGGWF